MEGTGTLPVGAVIADTFAILRRGGATLAALAALLLGLPQVLPWMVEAFVPNNPGLAGGAAVTAGILGFLLNIVFYGAATHAGLAVIEERPGSVRVSLGRGFRMFLGTLAINIRSGLGILIASLLLVVPGVMLFCSWAVVLPAYVAEGRVVGPAFARSRELTLGHRWRILGLCLVYAPIVVVLFLPTLLAAMIPSLASDTNALLGLQNVALDAASVLAEVGLVALYVALRRIADGAPANVLAAAFE